MDASWITKVKHQGKVKRTITFLPQHTLGLAYTMFANRTLFSISNGRQEIQNICLWTVCAHNTNRA